MLEPNNLGHKSNSDLTNQKIEFLAGRPIREKAIGEGDITNLKIALNTAKSLEHLFTVV